MEGFDVFGDDDLMSLPEPKYDSGKESPKPKKKAQKKPPAEAKAKPSAATEKPVKLPIPKANGKVQRTTSGREIILLDNRKLTKKNKSDLQIWQGRERGHALDSFFAGHVDRARAVKGHSAVMLGREADKLVIGIPMPGAIPLEFVICNDVWPLGLIVQIVAKTSVGKSGLLAEIGRWFDIAGGGLSLAEAETKFNPKWYQSILGPEAFDRMVLHRCNCLEEWQEHLTWSLADYKQALVGTEKNPGPGRTVPICFGVDSIMGKSSREVQDKILGKMTKAGVRSTKGEGSAGRGFPVEALKITRYLRSMPQELDGWPFSLVLINHLKLNTNDEGREERTKAGGKMLDFQESFELEIKRVGGRHRIRGPDYEGYTLVLSCEKNSFGYDMRSARVRVLWTDEETADGGWEQHTWFDWNWALVDLLNAIMTDTKRDEYRRLRKNLEKMDFHLSCPSSAEIQNKAWSRNLGMREKSAVPWTELGAMIHADHELSNRLRTALRINRRPVLAGDYLQQMQKIVENL